MARFATFRQTAEQSALLLPARTIARGTSLAQLRFEMKDPRRESGFTLVETLIVVGLIGVVSAIAVPMFGNAIANFRVSGDARSVSNAMAVAKMRAASNFSRVRLYLDVPG